MHGRQSKSFIAYSSAKTWVKGNAFFDIIRESTVGWSQSGAPLHAAALAFYTLFSLAPLIILSVAIASQIFSQPAVEAHVITEVDRRIGPEAVTIIQDIIQSHHNSLSFSIAAGISILFFLYGASTVFYQLQVSLNAMWDISWLKVDFRKSIITTIKARLLSAAFALVFCILLMVSLLVQVVWRIFLQQYLQPYLSGFHQYFRLLDFIISPILLTLVIAFLYKALLQADLQWHDLWPGALVTALLFWMGQFIMGQYLSRSALASLYGGAGSVIVFLIWVYYSASILLFGAKFTQVYRIRILNSVNND